MRFFEFESVEKIFESDIKAKKNETASLRNATKYKRLGKGNMKTAMDFMSRKEKKEHTKAGKVVTTNMYDTILPIDEFELLDEHEQRNRLAYWRTMYSNKHIMNEMKTFNARFYKIVNDLGLPKAPRVNSDEPRKPRKAPVKKVVAIETAAQTLLPEKVEESAPVVQEIILNGLNLNFNGTYQPEQIIKQLLKFGALLEGEDDDFYIELKLMQKAK
jgi:hypothetical protein